MRTSLNKIREAEQFLLGRMSTAEALVFQARLLVDRELRGDVDALRQTFILLQQRDRKLMHTRVEEVHNRLFNDPAKAEFRRAVFAHFDS